MSIHHLPARWPILFFAVLVIGLCSGLGGMFLVLLLHFIQHLAYEQSIEPIIGTKSFFYEVSTSTAQSRVIVLLVCGFISGLGWWAVFRYGRPLVSITQAIKLPRPSMPVKTTLAHILLQIITVALGSPLGREVAPRELGATFACWFTKKIQLTAKESQILVACAAGAGLAAVYNIPFAGALFTLEVLLKRFHWSALVPALTTSALAVVVSWIGLGHQPLYSISLLTLNYSIILWSIAAGPLFGFAAYWFQKMTSRFQSSAPHNWKSIVSCLVNFFMIGLLSIYFPELLGNGKSVVQLGFNGEIIGLGTAVVLLVLRVLIVCTSIRAGAFGGLLTPSLANGALMAVILGLLWGFFEPSISLPALAVIGSAAFLAAAQKMPLTAIAVSVEFTGINFSFFVPLLFAVSGSMGMFYLCTIRERR